MEYDVVIVGGGIAGLTCGWLLSQKGFSVGIWEAKSRPGGNVWTEECEGYRYECGPHSFMGSAQNVFDLASGVGLAQEIVPTLPSASRRFIVREGRLHQAPMDWWSFLTTDLLTVRGKLALMGEPFRTRRAEPTDTAQQYFERRFGEEGARILAGAFISGVYAGDPSVLSAPAAFPLFWKFEQESGSMIRGAWKHMRGKKAQRKALGETGPFRKGLYSFRRGMGQLSESIAKVLGDRIAYNRSVQSIHRESEKYIVQWDKGQIKTTNLVIAVGPPDAGPLLLPMDKELSELVSTIKMAPVATVLLGFEARQKEIPDGFGFLAPRGEGVRSLGVLFPSRLFWDRVPGKGDLLVGFVGGMLDEKALDKNDQELEELVMNDLAKLVGLRNRPSFVRIRRVSEAIPQFVVGHLNRMEKVNTRLNELPGLYLAGNYRKGVGMKDAIASGTEAAEEIIRKERNGQ